MSINAPKPNLLLYVYSKKNKKRKKREPKVLYNYSIKTAKHLVIFMVLEVTSYLGFVYGKSFVNKYYWLVRFYIKG